MATFNVIIEATIRKTITVDDAATEDEAENSALNMFNFDVDAWPQRYTQRTIEIWNIDE